MPSRLPGLFVPIEFFELALEFATVPLQGLDLPLARLERRSTLCVTGQLVDEAIGLNYRVLVSRREGLAAVEGIGGSIRAIDVDPTHPHPLGVAMGARRLDIIPRGDLAFREQTITLGDLLA